MRPIKRRIYEHLRNIAIGKNCSVLVSHFLQDDHDVDDFTFQIIEVMQNDEISAPFRKSRESYWMKILNTIYPMGLNDHVSGVGNVSLELSANKLFSVNPFFSVICPRRPRNRGLSKNRRKQDIDLVYLNTIKCSQVYHVFKKLSLPQLRTCLKNLDEVSDINIRLVIWPSC